MGEDAVMKGPQDMSERQEIFAAVSAGDVDRVRELIAADPGLAEARNDEGLSVLLHARFRFEVSLIDLLMEAGPQLDIFEAAALGRADQISELLLAAPASVNSRSPDGFTPLHLAAFFGSPETVAVLLENGAEVGAVSDNAQAVMPLHSAIAGGHGDICRMLVEYGADVNARQHAGWTPLHAAAENGDEALARQLMQAGADAAAVKEDGQRPADTARAKGHEEVAALIEGWTTAQ
jgi:ankyrin repeat protein